MRWGVVGRVRRGEVGVPDRRGEPGYPDSGRGGEASCPPEPPTATRPGRGWTMPMVAVLVATVSLVGTHYAAKQVHGHLDLPTLLLLFVGPVALLFSRRWPVPALVLTTVATVAYYGLGFPYGPQFTAFAVVLAMAVVAGHRVLAWVCGVGALVVYFLLYWAIEHGTMGPTWVLGHVAAVAAILALSELYRVHRQRVAVQRRIRAERERRQANEERLRIAQELHDVLAHNISLINVQAGVALHLMDQRPEQARTALSVIKQASKEALGEMRSALAVLRGETYAAHSPTPGLDRLDELTARLASAGLPVRTTVSGARRPLPVEVDLAAYRIVQEALTNVYRHAHAGEAVVSLAYRPELLTVLVTDDGTGGPVPRHAARGGTDPAGWDGADEPGRGGGNGIPGMRERATALGGSLSAGPLPGGGFRVVATFPLDEEAP